MPYALDVAANLPHGRRHRRNFQFHIRGHARVLRAYLDDKSEDERRGGGLSFKFSFGVVGKTFLAV